MLEIAVAGLGALALLGVALLLDLRGRRRTEQRERSSLHVALLLSRTDDGLALLADDSRGEGQWWLAADPEHLSAIDRALDTWNVVAGYLADHQVDRGVVLDVFGWRIIETWEQAFTYVEDSRPELWAPLLDLYVDAWKAAHPDEGDPQAMADPDEEAHAITPDALPEVEVVPSELLTDSESGTDRLADIRAALHDTTSPVEVHPPAPARRPAPEVDAPADLVIDLNGAEALTPRPVHR